MPHEGYDDPGHIDRVFEAMQVFLARHSVGGKLHFPAKETCAVPPPLPERKREPPAPSDVVVRFTSVEQFKHIHKTASEFEDALEARAVDDFNSGDEAFKAWPLLTMPEDDGVDLWVVLVESTPSIETRIPGIGESCQLRLVDAATGAGVSSWWPARRTHNNFAAVGGPAKAAWAKLIAFSMRLVKADNDEGAVIHPLIPDDGDRQAALDSLVLGDHNAVRMGFFFTKSDATFDAEMGSLGRIVKACLAPRLALTLPSPAPAPAPAPAPLAPLSSRPPQLPTPDAEPDAEPDAGPAPGPSPDAPKKAEPVKPALPPTNPHAVHPRQVAAFEYLLDFRTPAFTVDLFELFPHMRAPNAPGSGIPPALMKKYARMNDDQRRAYTGLLASMPCGLALLPGGPGGGKTDWAMTVIGIMQSKSRAKVLYLMDINDPLDDATAKYVGLVKNAGLGKRAIRMRNFGTELKRSIRIGTALKRARRNPGRLESLLIDNDEEPAVDFSRAFLRLYTEHASGAPGAGTPRTTRHQHAIPSLDEAAWDHYEAHKGDFEELTAQLQSSKDASAAQSRDMRREIYRLYAAVLRLADFVATTPCVAASPFRRMFLPDLVVFDEAAHARELSTLIAIANFRPRAGWIFIGDHRQTQPTVKSNDTNPYGRQLATSAMERAYLAGVLEHQLLINHRAFGSLERLPSKLIYGGQMRSGIAFRERFPAAARFVREYLERVSGLRCSVPRLVVHLQGVGRAVQVGTSWHHPQHTQWTMARALELVGDPRFRSAENASNAGTILLLAPYKAAVARYQAAIEALAEQHPALRIPQRVEARTWDSAQGHEADIVGIDYVREHPTGFMDGMYRFNVGLTRARQGEWHLMHPNMPRAASFRATNYLSKLYAACDGGLDGLGEGRIASLAWEGGAQQAQPAQPESRPAHAVPPPVQLEPWW